VSPFYGRAAYHATAELGIYVAPEFQHKGVATRLLGAAVSRAPGLGLTTLLGFIFGHNDPSLRLFEKFGFEEWGVLPRVAVLDSIERDLLILGRRTD
jgi:phosphinothricin acetyltransferase